MEIYSTTSEGLRHLFFKHNSTGFGLQIDDEFTSNLTVEKTISTSLDGIVWTDEIKYEEFNPSQTLPQGVEEKFFRLSIKIQQNSLNDFSNYTLNSIKILDEEIEIQRMELGQVFDEVIRYHSSINTFNPYRNSDFQKKLYDSISDAVNNVIGFPMLYFRTESDLDSELVTFKTYQLNHVVEIKQLKICVENNEIPDNLDRFDEFGFSFQDELILHIVKDEFKRVFGSDKRPNSNDFVYWPLTDKMYQLNSPYERKTFMQHATYWAVITTKYENRASVKEIEDDDEFHKIEDIIEFTHNYKSDIENLEQEDATKDFNEKEKFFSDNHQKVSDDDNERFKYSFDYYDSEINSVIKKSNFFQEFKQNDPVILSSWMKFKDEQSLFRIYSQLFEDEIIVETKRISSSSFTVSVYHSVTIIPELPVVSTTIEIENLELQQNQWYGLVVRFNNNDLTIEIYDKEIELLNERTLSITKIQNYPSNIEIYGGLKFNLLRLAKKEITSYDLLTDKLPSKKDFVMLINATPTAKINEHEEE